MTKLNKRCFLRESDSQDLLEEIKRVNPSLKMKDDKTQRLLKAIEKKFCDVHKAIWDDIITVTITGSRKSTLMEKIIEAGLSGFIVVEINHQNHFIRYVNQKIFQEI